MQKHWKKNSTKRRYKRIASNVVIIAIIISIIMLCVKCVAGDNTSVSAVIRNHENVRIPISLEIVDTDSKRALGLSHRKSLPQNAGMLFVFDESQRLSFWMKDTHIPLDIAFMDDNMKITEIFRNLQPLSLKAIYSSEIARYALEVNAGYFDSNYISVGDRLFL